MDDLISRQVAINEFDVVKVDEENCTEYDIGYNDGIDFAVSRLSVLPSAQLDKLRWIPCSERQPDVNGWYITTISGEICGQDRAFSGMSEFANGKWMSGDDVDETEMTIAWMPLPEPYQGESEDKE